MLLRNVPSMTHLGRRGSGAERTEAAAMAAAAAPPAEGWAPAAGSKDLQAMQPGLERWLCPQQRRIQVPQTAVGPLVFSDPWEGCEDLAREDLEAFEADFRELSRRSGWFSAALTGLAALASVEQVPATYWRPGEAPTASPARAESSSWWLFEKEGHGRMDSAASCCGTSESTRLGSSVGSPSIPATASSNRSSWSATSPSVMPTSEDFSTPMRSPAAPPLTTRGARGARGQLLASPPRHGRAYEAEAASADDAWEAAFRQQGEMEELRRELRVLSSDGRD